MKTKGGLDIWSGYKKVTGVGVLVLEGLEEQPGGRPLGRLPVAGCLLEAGRHERNVPKQQCNYTILVSLVKK